MQLCKDLGETNIMSKNKRRNGGVVKQLTKGLAKMTKVVVYKPLYAEVPRKAGFTLTVPDNLWAFAQNILTITFPNESAGFAEVVDGGISWMWWDKEAKVTSGSVESSQGRGLVAALQANRSIGMQWHTHPDFDTFWSSTDENDQRDMMNRLAENQPSGHFTFLVLNFKSWRLRRIHWDNHKVSLIEDGYATNSRGTLLNVKDRTYSYVTKPTGKPKALTLDDDPYGDLLYGPDLYGGNLDWSNHNLHMMGEWSKNEEDYAELFEAAGVTFGYWHLLKQRIEDTHGKGIYDLVVNDPDLWEYVYDGRQI